MSNDIPPLARAVPAKARAAKSGDPRQIAEAQSNLTAARINSALSAALAADGAALKPEHAAALVARIQAVQR